MRLLLVEDERKLSQVLAKGLKKLSYAVDQAFDGRGSAGTVFCLWI